MKRISDKGGNKFEASIRRLPFDILHQIAMYNLPVDPDPTFKQFLLPFGRVCSAWRETIISSRRLWTTLYIVIRTPGSLKDAAVNEWFRRASDRPTTLYIDFKIVVAITSAELDRFFTSLFPTLVHLSHLGLRAPTIPDLRPLLGLPLQWSVPNLQQLDIRSLYPGLRSRREAPPGKFFMTAPPLTALTLNSRLDISELHPLLTWSQMVHLSFGHAININEWFNLMKRAVNLQTAFFSLSGLPGKRLIPQPLFVHPCLLTLSLVLNQSCSSIPLRHIIQMFHPSKLKMLQVFREDDDPQGFGLHRPSDSNTDFSVNNSRLLEKLESFSIRFHFDENLRPVLLRTCNLRKLSVRMEGTAFAYRLLSSLSHIGAAHVLPQLSSLQIIIGARTGSTYQSCLALDYLLRSIKPIGRGTLPCGCQPLQTLNLHFEGQHQGPQIPDGYVAECKEGGLDVKIVHGRISNSDSLILDDIVPRPKSFDNIR